VAFLAAAGVLATLALGHALWLPRPATTPHPAAQSAGGFLADALRSFFVQDRAAVSLAFILLFRAGDALMFAMNAPLLKSLGLDTDMRGLVSGGLGTVASIAGSIAGGVLIAKRGLERTLVPIATVQSLAILLYVALAALRPSLPVITAIVVIEQLIAGVGTAAFMVFILRRCDGPHKASHFALATALMSLAATGAGSVSGLLAERVGFVAFFAIAFVASLPGVFVSRLVPRT
jgi:PAT family beta-lactamase induction signal transducer AmpG